MTSYFLPDINAVSMALPNKNFMSYTFIFHKQLYFIISGLKTMGHRNPDNNFESHCMYSKLPDIPCPDIWNSYPTDKNFKEIWIFLYCSKTDL
jgi:hypothetical protein